MSFIKFMMVLVLLLILFLFVGNLYVVCELKVIEFNEILFSYLDRDLSILDVDIILIREIVGCVLVYILV